MSDDIVEVIKNKMDTLSDTINHQFDTSFLFEYLFPTNKSLNTNKHEITMELFSNNNPAELNYIALMNTEGEGEGEGEKKDLNKKENFANNTFDKDDMDIPNDILSQVYFASLGVLGIYILYGVMKKTKLLPM